MAFRESQGLCQACSRRLGELLTWLPATSSQGRSAWQAQQQCDPTSRLYAQDLIPAFKEDLIAILEHADAALHLHRLAHQLLGDALRPSEAGEVGSEDHQVQSVPEVRIEVEEHRPAGAERADDLSRDDLFEAHVIARLFPRDDVFVR